MPRYRLYFLNPGGRIEAVSDLDCQSDEQAIAESAEASDGRGMELWERERRVKSFPALGSIQTD
ncbi:MAG: hypothetical protein JWM33_2780 [Caulobacteraceae bacterium]|nr:hypothetical protein [Caulobacteraceae bacterium]